jgi:hypothetical protein
VFFELERWRFWRCTPALHRRLFVGDVHGGTLLYRRRLWELAGGYPDRSLAEDAALLRQMQRRGGRLLKLPNRDLFIYLRHAANAWSFVCGKSIWTRPAGWLWRSRRCRPRIGPSTGGRRGRRRAPRLRRRPLRPACPARLRPRPAASPPARGRWSPASCPRPAGAPSSAQAIAYFQRQDYRANRELIVVDDGVGRGGRPDAGR